jgi:chromosome segregation protein
LYLKRIELLGFKSFATKTILELERGITGIVGPNGSGKSNVADAVRWALGEQSLRAIRSRKSDEVIFAGNARRPAVGMAEVTLVFDNSDGDLPLSFTEVSITRRQYRSGDGEYLINKARARLRDIVELLTHARLGPDSYAMVGQGAVDEVLLQRPEDRRMLIEAASDISRYQMKLKESLDKLREMEGNIQRVEDIRSEITPQINRLRQQAHRAQRYEQVARKLKEMTGWRYLLQIRAARERALEEMEREKVKSEASIGAAQAQESSYHRVAELRGRLREEETALEAAREHLNGLKLARATAEREAALLREREAAYKRQLKEGEEELARVQKERGELRAQIEKLENSRSEVAARLARLRAELSPVEKEWQRATSEQRLLQAQFDRIASERQGLKSRRSELQERRNALARELFRAEQLRKESLAAVSKATGQLEQLERELTSAQEGIDALRAELGGVEAGYKEAQAKLAALSRELEVARRAERKAWEEDKDLQNRLAILQSLKEQHRGLAEGARIVLQGGLGGIRGTLSSMVKVPEEYVPAVAAALSEAQGYVVFESPENGIEALELLSNRKAAATVTPLKLEEGVSFRDLVRDFRSGLEGLLEGVDFRGLASELVACPEEAQELSARYLGFTLVVGDLDGALELYRRTLRHCGAQWPFQVVTLDGRVLRARGDMVSTPTGGKDTSLLARENELQSLSQKANEARDRLQKAREAVAALETTHSQLSGQIRSDAATMSRLQGEIGKRTSAHAEIASRLGKVEASVEWHRSRIATAERDAAQAQNRLTKAEDELSALTTKELESDGRAEQLQDDLAAQRAEVAEIAGNMSKLQSEASTAQNQLREMDARIAAVSEGLQRADGSVRRQEERVSQLSNLLAQMAKEPKVSLPASLLKDLDDAEKVVAERSSLVTRLRGELASAETELAERTKALEVAREDLSNIRSKTQRVAVELASLVKEAARESGFQVEEVETDTPSAMVECAYGAVEKLRDILVDAPLDSFPDTLESVSQKVESLRKEVQSIGAINADAPEEYRQLSERYSFLAAQLDDLRRAERTLQKAIEELKEIMEQRFRESFDRVNTEFAHCFSTLFNGGSARLVLTQPDQPLQGGVEILVNLPGKKSGSLLGLSGGERALTAIALLFALMRVNPSPFCMLDEVDAALDESNVRRFCALVGDLTSSTQFLIITHNRASMEIASALYGVSMNSDSTSRVMSLKLAGKETAERL